MTNHENQSKNRLILLGRKEVKLSLTPRNHYTFKLYFIVYVVCNSMTRTRWVVLVSIHVYSSLVYHDEAVGGWDRRSPEPEIKQERWPAGHVLSLFLSPFCGGFR